MRNHRLNPSARALITIAAVAASVGSAGAQVSEARFEVRPFVGAFVPTGNQRDVLEDAVLTGAAFSWLALPALSITGVFAWSPSKDRITPGSETLDIYQYDVGAELRAASWYRATRWDFTPFLGAGLGARTYDYRELDARSKTNVDGYVALGGDIGLGRIGIRLEARDYVSRFEPLIGDGDTRTRNDIGLLVGLAYRF